MTPADPLALLQHLRLTPLADRVAVDAADIANAPRRDPAMYCALL